MLAVKSQHYVSEKGSRLQVIICPIAIA